jgi:hypothetical protein
MQERMMWESLCFSSFEKHNDNVLHVIYLLYCMLHKRDEKGFSYTVGFSNRSWPGGTREANARGKRSEGCCQTRGICSHIILNC